MTVLSLLVYFGGTLGFLFITLCLASGLYYLAELVEEYTVMTKRVIKYTSYVIIGFHLLLLIDRLPAPRILFSLGCHGVYYLLLKDFPNIQITNPTIEDLQVLVICDHFVWFFYFTQNHHAFKEIAVFFGLIVWLVPFMYFISLSANDYTLPSFDASRPAKKKSNLVKTILNLIVGRKDDLFPASNASNASNGTFTDAQTYNRHRSHVSGSDAMPPSPYSNPPHSPFSDQGVNPYQGGGANAYQGGGGYYAKKD